MLRVWAPHAARVELEAVGRRRAMKPTEGGWWTVEAPDVDTEVDYAFAVNGGLALPDPRAARLPSGVHGPARRVDHGAFPWTDGGWQAPSLTDGVVYELHVGTFSPEGTFDGVVDRLDHLVALGVTHLELMPVNSFPGAFGWGYDGTGLYAPHEPYGGPDGLKRLVDACHARGLAVILDVVYNHFGPDGNYLPVFGPYLTDLIRTPWGDAVNYGGAGSDEVRRFVIDNALGWLRDYHLDGLRLDAVHAIVDLTATHILEELGEEVRALEAHLGRPLVLVAESDLNDPRHLRAPAVGGYGLDAQWSDDFHHALHVALTGQRTGYYEDFIGLADLAVVLERSWVYDGRYSPHRGRRHGRSPDGIAPNRLIGFLQNHDQVGNRAAGERMAMLVDDARLRVGAAIALTAPFTPMLFAGEEWGVRTPFLYFADHADAGLRAAVRDGRRAEFAAFGWAPEDVPDPGDPETFRRSILDWSEPAREPHAGLLDWHRRLIALRRRLPALRDGTHPPVSADVASGTLLVARPGVAVAANLGPRPASVAMPEELAARDVLASQPDVRVADDAVVLPPWSVAILTG